MTLERYFFLLPKKACNSCSNCCSKRSSCGDLNTVMLLFVIRITWVVVITQRVSQDKFHCNSVRPAFLSFMDVGLIGPP